MRKFEANYRITMEKILRVLDLNTKVMKKFCDENYIDLTEIFKEEQ